MNTLVLENTFATTLTLIAKGHIYIDIFLDHCLQYD